MYPIYLMENISLSAQNPGICQFQENLMCMVKVTMWKTPPSCGGYDLGWDNHHLQRREKASSFLERFELHNTHLFEQHAYNILQLGLQVYTSIATKSQSIYKLEDTLCA